MSQVEVTPHQQDQPKDEGPLVLEDVALQFFRLMHQKKNPRLETKSPGLPPKSASHVQADSNAEGQQAEALLNNSHLQSVGAEASPTAETGSTALGSDGGTERAKLIAEHLIAMGDDLEAKLQLAGLSMELKEAFEKQFKIQSVFHMAYEGFSKTCISFLSRTRNRISNGWEQLYFLAYGQYVVSEELYRAAPEGAQNRITATARYFKDTVHDIGLDDWIEAQGGMANVGRVLTEDDMKVEVNPPEDSSVDK